MPRAERASIPRTVWTLGYVSLFMDLSSELIHALLPIFLVTTMGMSVAALGALEGAAEATALISKMFSGALSDYLGRRKGLLLWGYGLAALTKPMFPLATSPVMVAVARLLDRVGKGIRGAPRDAMVADVAPASIRGACFGLRQSMDTVGAFLGPILAMGLMLVFGGNIRAVLWFAVLPACVVIGLIVFGVAESGQAPLAPVFRSPLSWHSLKDFSRRYWLIVGVGAMFSLARFSEAFLVLRAQQTGLALAWIPGVMVVMSAAYSLSAYPAGKLLDRVDGRVVLGLGMGMLVAADLLLAKAGSAWILFVGVTVWGLHMGFTEGILTAMVSAVAPAALRGTAFGLFNLACGVSVLVASVVAGWVWDRYGSATTFAVGAGLVVLPLALCAFLPRRATEFTH